MIRVDSYPTHETDGIKYRIGSVLPYGASIVPNGVNFSIFSKYATSCELVLFKKREKKPYAVIPFPDEFRIGDVFSMIVFDIDYDDVEYGYRMDGKFAPSEGLWFNKDKYLLDPYAKAVSGRNVWGTLPDYSNEFQHRGRIVYDDFDWEGDKQLEFPMNDLIIYEMHLRSFTSDPSSNVKHKGTFAGVVEKVPYLKELGINCVELLPIFEFDEFENSKTVNGKRLYNYWGYSTVNFFAPKAGYAATGKYGMETDELKNMIKILHKNGIEVILDVVFNHTAEGNENGPYISYRGIDNKTYYLLTPKGYYYNFSGCGNTLNCNNSIVRNYILDCLRYWVSEYHIDGFRFDLASILSRDQNGVPMQNPPLIETLAHDAILSKCKLIAEAWDAGGLYQVGNFPSWGRWAEWNGKYRDNIRKFLKGDEGTSEEFIKRLEGSKDLYEGRTSNASINFITSHDGFTLYDLVSYNKKHNMANGENNEDGTEDNNSWNCGVEGETPDPSINFFRKKQIKNAITLLLMSRGVPMILSGDEFSNTQFGNNNAYCQDNEISWLDWKKLDENKDIFNFFSKMIKFRKDNPVLKNNNYDTEKNRTGYPEVSWHTEKPWDTYNINNTLSLAVMFVEEREKYGIWTDKYIYMAINMHWEMHKFELPVIPEGKKWYILCNTACCDGKDIFDESSNILIENQSEIVVNPRSIIIVIGK
ncbi:glycogen debranching protein GlgX [Clostridium sp. BJN0001]|uniref:glycogen debranching protein GlgX n=1 Tax=Clostridium sp. BJN0001 TaxID=2930219 RepID=UPI001FD3899B|nr:glycogen debranching protein GlgX [Clostridium sp. BJN0001]